MIYKLHTNEGVSYRDTRPTRAEMFAYIKAKQARGWTLAAIVFCWHPIHVRKR